MWLQESKRTCVVTSCMLFCLFVLLFIFAHFILYDVILSVTVKSAVVRCVIFSSELEIREVFISACIHCYILILVASLASLSLTFHFILYNYKYFAAPFSETRTLT